MPSEGSKDGYECVFERIRVIDIAYENVERELDIDGKPSSVQREFELVSVIDVSIEVRRFRRRYPFKSRRTA
jgi:hypothetical protein